MTKPVPPATFLEKMRVPEVGYRTALAIKHDVKTREVTVTFVLRDQDGQSASYAALCPRCNVGELIVEVGLAPDGSFADIPACPTLCLGCEDALDALLEPAASPDLQNSSGDRATLNTFLKLMNARSWH